MDQVQDGLEPIFFWGSKDTFAAFSNFYPSTIEISGRTWKTVEHFYQAMKTNDVGQQKAIQDAESPGQAKRLGQKVLLRPDWEEIKQVVMLTALRVKFADEPYRSMLLSTGERPIYEDSPYDKIWGTGVRGHVGEGQNLLGKLLMRVRQELRDGTA